MPRPLAEKRIYVPRGKKRIVYVFDANGKEIDEGQSAEIMEKYNCQQLRGYIKKERIFDQKYYFSLSTGFKVPKGIKTKNPVLRKKINTEKERMKDVRECLAKYNCYI